MGRFRNSLTGVVVSVDDSKDNRYGDGWEPEDTEKPAKKPAAKKSS